MAPGFEEGLILAKALDKIALGRASAAACRTHAWITVELYQPHMATCIPKEFLKPIPMNTMEYKGLQHLYNFERCSTSIGFDPDPARRLPDPTGSGRC